MLALSGLFALFMALVLLFVFWQYQMNKGRFSFFSAGKQSVSEQEKYDILESLRAANGTDTSFEEKVKALQALADLDATGTAAEEEEVEAGTQASASGSGSQTDAQQDAATGPATSASQEEKLRILESLRE